MAVFAAMWSLGQDRAGGATEGLFSVLQNLREPTPDWVESLADDDPLFVQQAPGAIGQGGALLDQPLADPMHQQNILLLRRLDRHKPHVRPTHRLADRLRIVGIVLVALHIGVATCNRKRTNLQLAQFSTGISCNCQAAQTEIICN